MLPGGPLSVNPLEDLDRVARLQLHDCLLPPRLASLDRTTPLRLRLHLRDVHAQDFDVEQLLDRLADLRLVRVRVDAERVGVAALDLRVALLRHDGSKQDFVWMQTHRRTSGETSRFPQTPSPGPLTRTGNFVAGWRLIRKPSP